MSWVILMSCNGIKFLCTLLSLNTFIWHIIDSLSLILSVSLQNIERGIELIWNADHDRLISLSNLKLLTIVCTMKTQSQSFRNFHTIVKKSIFSMRVSQIILDSTRNFVLMIIFLNSRKWWFCSLSDLRFQ